jgi:hypothetical protein
MTRYGKAHSGLYLAAITAVLVVAGCTTVPAPEGPEGWLPDQPMVERIESLVSLQDCPGSIREYERYYTGVFLQPGNRRFVMGYVIGPMIDAATSRMTYPSGRTYPSYQIVPLHEVPDFTDVGCYVTFDVQANTVAEGIPIQ